MIDDLTAFRLIIILAGAFLATVCAIRIFLKAAPKVGAIARPTERGSHKVPVPTGAGIAIFIVSAAFLAIIDYNSGSKTDLYPFVVSGLLITILGFADDVKPLPPHFRLLLQFAAVIPILYAFGPYQFLPGLPEIFGFAGTFILIVLFMNVFNFMDGSDGIVGLHALVVMIGWAVTGYLLGFTLTALLAVVFIGIFAGFLVFNWHPSKVFLGDAGSTYIGFLLAVFPLTSKAADSQVSADALIWPFVLFSWMFLFDAVYSRCKRLLAVGSRFWEPNRSHFYQRMVDSGVKQDSVAGIYGVMTAIILAGTVYSAVVGGSSILLPVALAILLPGVLIWITYKKEIDLNI